MRRRHLFCCCWGWNESPKVKDIYSGELQGSGTHDTPPREDHGEPDAGGDGYAFEPRAPVAAFASCAPTQRRLTPSPASLDREGTQPGDRGPEGPREASASVLHGTGKPYTGGRRRCCELTSWRGGGKALAGRRASSVSASRAACRGGPGSAAHSFQRAGEGGFGVEGKGGIAAPKDALPFFSGDLGGPATADGIIMCYKRCASGE